MLELKEESNRKMKRSKITDETEAFEVRRQK